MAPPRVLVNAAGVNPRDALLVRARDADVEECVRTNLLGTMYLTRAVATSALRRRSGAAGSGALKVAVSTGA